MIFLTHHNNIWHPESLYGVSWLKPTSKVIGGNQVGSGGQCPPGDDPTIRQPGFTIPRQQWSLLNRFRTGQGCCGACRKTWCLYWDPNDVPRRWILPSYQTEPWSVSPSLCWWRCYCLLTNYGWILIAYARRRSFQVLPVPVYSIEARWCE